MMAEANSRAYSWKLHACQSLAVTPAKHTVTIPNDVRPPLGSKMCFQSILISYPLFNLTNFSPEVRNLLRSITTIRTASAPANFSRRILPLNPTNRLAANVHSTQISSKGSLKKLYKFLSICLGRNPCYDFSLGNTSNVDQQSLISTHSRILSEPSRQKAALAPPGPPSNFQRSS